MKLSDIEEIGEYQVENFGNLSPNEIEELNKIGLIEGEVIQKDFTIRCKDNLCMFTIENTDYSINKKYVKEVEVAPVYE